MVRQGVLAHQAIFVNDTLSQLNSHYVRRESFHTALEDSAELDSTIQSLCKHVQDNGTV
jgi:hypothetical protein